MPMYPEPTYYEYEDESVMPMYPENRMEREGEEEPYRRSETAREIEKATASGEETAGPVGAAAGGVVGAGVGLVKDTAHLFSGKPVEETDEEAMEEENEMPVRRTEVERESRKVSY